ncbi:MAG: hypothetical protein NTU41_12460 [Chloroflexi bacterium]|nr:hypothetical protein [Chloroflexota bacterium]
MGGARQVAIVFNGKIVDAQQLDSQLHQVAGSILRDEGVVFLELLLVQEGRVAGGQQQADYSLQVEPSQQLAVYVMRRRNVE